LHVAESEQVYVNETRVIITTANGHSVILCVPPGDRAGREALLRAQGLPALMALAGAQGGEVCGGPGEHEYRAAVVQQAGNQAGLVIDFGNGRVETFCIDLGGDGQMTGEELLLASGLPVVIEYSGGRGGAVCTIDGVGSSFPSEPCFAQCTLLPGEACLYWSFSRMADSGWALSPLGGSSVTARPGDVHGWAWGEGSRAQGAFPPVRRFAEVCAPGQTTPWPTLTPSNTPVPTNTPIPTNTPVPTAAPTVLPTATPTATPTAEAISLAPTHTILPSPTPPTVTAEAPAASETDVVAPAPSLTALSSSTVAPTLATTAEPSTLPAGDPRRIVIPFVEAPASAPSTAGVQATGTPSPVRVAAAPTAVPPEPTPATIVRSAAETNPAQSYRIFAGIALFLIGCWIAIWFLRRSRPA
jgi:hypothetical protein